MSPTARYLKAAWVRRQVDLALPLLPPGTDGTLWVGEKSLIEIGKGCPLDGAAKAKSFPLSLEGEPAGILILSPPPGAEAQAESWGGALVHGLQALLEAEHARRAVARETLESYRDMALLQRAVTDLNHSLQPAAVAESLLREFDGRKDAADYGAVFLSNPQTGMLEPVQTFGKDAEEAFRRLGESRLFSEMAKGGTGDIINDLAASPLWKENGTGFHALLWLPLISHGETLGLLVLASPRTEGFSANDLKRAQTLSSVAATALHNAQLYAAQQDMFQSFVKVMSTAIDAKSHYTAGHCRRVPEIALMLAETAHRAGDGPLAGFVLEENERDAMEIAAMLHDCGKVITPEWIVDKATKLDAIINRIDLVALRFEALRRDAAIDLYRALADGEEESVARQAYSERLDRLDDDFSFIEKCNRGSEFVSDEHISRMESIAKTTWRNARGEELPLLTENEVYNLSTRRGTLNPEERKTIEDHAVHTINMLSQIAFPRSLSNVTEYAAGHHERMDGTGYPRGLKADQLSIPARIVAIADIFEALTAPDRPYRKPGTLSWSIDIMHRMKLDNHIDGDLFDLFLSERVWADYAEKHLSPAQIDEVDIGRYLG